MKPEPASRHFQTSLAIARWREQLRHFFLLQPHTESELVDLLRDAKSRHLLDAEALHIMEGALCANNTQVDEIMVPRPQMIALKYGQPPESLLKAIIESGHSRFPVVGESIDDIKGILLAKRLLPLLLTQREPFDITQVMHPVHMVPENKRIIDLLREFREQRYHMAIVVDEYGGVSGLVTIEDVLEEIVGDIEDETDEDEDDQFIRKLNPRDYLVKALTPISDFNQYFNATLSDEEYDTIGGLLMKQFGHLPRRNEMAGLDNFRFRVLNADSRQIHLLRMTVPAPYGKDSENES
jgi:magnesium and cobalt transporter